MASAMRADGPLTKASVAAVVLPAAASQLWFVTLPPFLPTIAEAIGVSTALAGQIVGLPVLLAAVLILGRGPAHRRLRACAGDDGGPGGHRRQLAGHRGGHRRRRAARRSPGGRIRSGRGYSGRVRRGGGAAQPGAAPPRH